MQGNADAAEPASGPHPGDQLRTPRRVERQDDSCAPAPNEGQSGGAAAHPFSDTAPLLPPTERADGPPSTEANGQDDDRTMACPPGFDVIKAARRSGVDHVLGTFGEYELLEKIAQGGMGIIFKARQQKPHRIVALKMIRAECMGSNEDLERFQLEAEAVAKLDHPGIVPIFDLGEVNGQHYFSMAFVDGGSLSERLKQGPLRPRLAASFMTDVADALEYAHQQGIIHRDLKPSNILLDSAGKPRVTDFGLAKNFKGDSQLTKDTQVLGTPSFMPPEQAGGGGKAIGPAADVYALGATLYCLLTGRPPFQAATPVETLKQVLEREPVSLRQLNPAVDRDLETICLKCLQKDPARRYASAAGFAADLRRFLAGAPIEARPLGIAERAWRWCRRKPLVASLTAGIACSLLAGAITATVLWVRAAREAAAARAAQRQSDLRWYVAEMNLALQDWKEGYVASAQARLARQVPSASVQPDPRGFDWYYLQRLFNPELATLSGHSSPVRCVSFSPDGTNFASASGPFGYPAEIRIWKTADHTALVSVHPPWVEVFGLAYGPKGDVLAAVGRVESGAGEVHLGEVRLWDAQSGRELKTISSQSQRGARCVAFHPREKLLAVGESAGLIEVTGFDGKSVKILRASEAAVLSIAFSPDGRFLASADNDGTVLIWEWTVGRIVHRLEGAAGSVYCVAFSHDGTLLAASGADNVIHFWNASSGQLVNSLHGHTDAIRNINFGADGTLLASASDDRTIRIWELSERGVARTLRGHSEPVFGVAFAPDGWRLASAGGDGTVKLWDARQPHEYRLLYGHRGPVDTVAFSPDRTRIASAGVDDAVRVFDAGALREIATLRGHAGSISSLAYSADGSWLASSGEDGTVRIWDAVTGAQRRVLSGHTTPIYCIALARDRPLLVSAGAARERYPSFEPYRGELVIWNAATGTKIKELVPSALEGDPRGYLSVVVTPDARTVVASCGDGTIRIWDVESGKTRQVPGEGEGRSWRLALSPDAARFAAACEDKNIRIRELATGRLLATLRGHTAPPRGVTFAPDGRRLASVIAGHGTNTLLLRGELKLWDLTTAQEILTLRDRPVCAFDIAFSPDGRRLVTAHSDAILTLWDGAEPTSGMALDRAARSLVGQLFDQPRRPGLAEVERTLTADKTIDDSLRSAAVECAQVIESDHLRQEAERLVDNLKAKAMFRDEMVSFLRADPKLSEDLRREAIHLAEHSVEAPRALNNHAREVVRRPDASREAVGLALRRAEAACRLVPFEGRYQATLGMAQYRMGLHQEAASSLARADSLDTEPIRGGVPADLAFLAMALHRLGKEDPARAAFSRLETAMKRPEWSGDAESQDFLREARATFAEHPK
jgi:WD40 repeat protein/serine/threonine protein kinase